MRLYTVIPNEVLFDKFFDNNSLSFIDGNDLEGTFNDIYVLSLTSMSADYIFDIDLLNSVTAFTTPNLAKQYLNDKNVLISFDNENSKFQLFNNNVLLNYMKMTVNYEDKLEDENLSTRERMKISDAQSKLQKIASEEIIKSNYYDSFVQINSIPTYFVKNCFIPQQNVEAIKRYREAKNCNLNCYIAENNNKIVRGVENVQ